MDDAVAMRVLEPVRDLAHELECGVHRQPPVALEPSAQRFTFDVRHHVPQQPVHAAGVEQGQDMRMLERRGDANLLQKSFCTYGSGQFFAQHLDGDEAMVPHVAREIDNGHAAVPDLAPDGVPADECRREAIGKRRRRGWTTEPLGGGALEKVAGVIVRREQRLHFPTQPVVALARLGHERVAHMRLAGEGGLEHHLHGAPAVGGHGDGAYVVNGSRHEASSRRSHMRAMAHSRPSVAVDTPSIAAASGMLSPAK